MARTRKGETGTDAATPDEDSAIGTPPDETAGDTEMPLEPPSAATPAPEEPRRPLEAAHRPEAMRRGGGFLPTALGGAIAAGLGFGAAAYALPRFWTPQVPVAEITAMRDGLVQQAARLDTLSKAVDAAAADQALRALDVDHAGLDALDHRYLNCIALNFGGGPVGIA